MAVLGKIDFDGEEKDLADIFTGRSHEERYWTLSEELTLAFDIRRATCLFFHLAALLNDRTGYTNRYNTMAGKKDPAVQQMKRFNSAYSLFVMGRSIAERCVKYLRSHQESQAVQLNGAKQFRLVVGNGFIADLKQALANYVQSLKISKSVTDTLVVSRNYWEEVARQAADIAREMPDFLRLIEGAVFHYNKFVISGLTAGYEQRGAKHAVLWKPVQPHEVIGNPQLTLIMLRQADRLALYRPQEEKNPFCVFGGILESILLDGLPGTGKTTLQQMFMTRLARRCEQVGVPFLFKILTADQIKSEFYGKTAQLMGEFLEPLRQPASVGALLLDDIDLLVKKSRNAPDSGGADNDILEALMRFLAGLGTFYRGNYISIAATNEPTGSDDALRQRFVYRANMDGPQTREDFIDLLHKELGGFAQTGLLQIPAGQYRPFSRNFCGQLANQNLPFSSSVKNDVSLDDIGAFCAELKQKDPRFTGRPVRNAMQVAMEKAAAFDIPEVWFEDRTLFIEKPWDDKLAILKGDGFYKPLTGEMIIHALEEQFSVEQRYVKEKHDKSIGDEADRIVVISLAAEEAKARLRSLSDER